MGSKNVTITCKRCKSVEKLCDDANTCVVCVDVRNYQLCEECLFDVDHQFRLDIPGDQFTNQVMGCHHKRREILCPPGVCKFCELMRAENVCGLCIIDTHDPSDYDVVVYTQDELEKELGWKINKIEVSDTFETHVNR